MYVCMDVNVGDIEKSGHLPFQNNCKSKIKMNSPPLFCMHAQQILCFQIWTLREMYIFQATVTEADHSLYPWTHTAEHECEYQPNLASKIVWNYTEKKVINCNNK